MPDNSTNWSADDDFWEDAWKDMNRQLDEHLPVSEKRRTPGLFWWATGAGTLVLLLAIGYFGVLGLQSSNSEKSSNDQPRPSQVATIEKSNLPITPAQTNVRADRQLEGKVINDEVLATARPQTKLVKPGNLDDSQAQTYPVVVQPEGSNASTERKAFSGSEDLNAQERDRGSSKTSNAGKQLSNEVAQDQNPIKALKESLNLPEKEENQHLAEILNKVRPVQNSTSVEFLENESPVIPTEPALNTESLNLLAGKIVPPKLRRTSLYVEMISSHGTRSPGLGYGFGLVAERKLNQKHALSASLGFRAQRQQFSFSAPVLEADDSFISSPADLEAQQDSVNAVYDNFDRYLEDEARNYVTSYDVRLGIGYTYSFNRRWSIGVEGGINFLINGFAPSLLNAIQNGGEFTSRSEFNLVDNSGFGFSFNELDEAIGASNANPTGEESATDFTTHRLRADLGFNVGYQLGHRWQLKSGFRAFLQPVVSSEVLTLNPYRLTIGLRYQLR